MGLRRIAAWCVDWIIIIGYALLLVPLGYLVGTRLELSPLAWNAISFTCLIAPVTLWLSWWETGPRAASPGKRVLRLRVQTASGGQPGFGRALARNALKVALPWEAGHTLAFIFSAPPYTTADWIVAWIAAVLAYGLMLVYVISLFIGAGRTPYDRIAGTRVTRLTVQG